MSTLVFEVITERLDKDNTVKETRQYVTQESNSLEEVARWFTRHCEEYDEDLKSVREVVSLMQHIPD